MTRSNDLTTILDRIAAGTYRHQDIDELQRLAVRGDRNSVVVGNHNIALHGAREIHIDNRVYRGGDVDAIREVLSALPAVGGIGGIGVLRGLGGVVATIGVLVSLVGMGLFFYNLLSLMAAGPTSPGNGPPPMLITGFALAVIGGGIGIIAGLITGWSRRTSR